MDLDFNQFTELIDIRPDPGCQFIHSMSEPFSEEDIEDRIMHNWLEHFQMRFHQLHASGHMNRQQIVDLVKYVKPERIFPVHTENPHLFQETGSSLHKVKCGEEYRLK
jgi:ribonuclease J